MRRTLLTVSLLLSQVTAQAPEMREVDVILRAIDERGGPIKGAGVVIGHDLTTDMALKSPMATSGEDGSIRCRIRLPTTNDFKQQDLHLAAPGRCSARFVIWEGIVRREFPSPKLIDLGHVALRRGWTLTGRVRDPNGDPVAGARVVVADPLAVDLGWEAIGGAAKSDAEGIFVLHGVPTYATKLEIDAAGYYRTIVPSAEPGTPLDLTIHPSGFVTGTISNADGSRFTDRVLLFHEFDSDWRSHAVTEGRFRVPVELPGRYRVAIMDASLQTRAVTPVLEEPAHDLSIEVAPIGDGDVFRVRAVDSRSGEPIRDIRAGITWFSDLYRALMYDTLAMAMVPADERGSVRLRAATTPRTENALAVLADGWAADVRGVGKVLMGKEHVAQLTPEATITGHLVDAVTGKPLQSVRVAAERVSTEDLTWPARATTDSSGAFRLRGLAAGRYRVTARHPNGRIRAEQELEVAADDHRSGVTLEMPVGHAITGRVLGDVSPGVAWRLCLLDQSNAPKRAGLFDDAPPGGVPIRDRCFAIPHLPDGRGELFLTIPSRTDQIDDMWIPIEQVVVAGEDLAIEIDLANHLPGHLRGTLKVLGASPPLDRLAVVAERRSDPRPERWNNQPFTQRWTLIDADGSYELPLQAGSYDVHVRDTHTGVPLLSLEQPQLITTGETSSFDIELPLATLHVRFDSDAPHVPVKGITVIRSDIEWDHRLPFGDEGLGTMGFRIDGDNRAVTFFVPPGAIQVCMLPGADSLGDDGPIASGRKDGQAPIALEQGQEHTEVLPTPTAHEIKTR